MLLKQLSPEDKRIFLSIAELLTLADKPVSRNDTETTRGGGAHPSFSTTLFIHREQRDLDAINELVWQCDLSSNGKMFALFTGARNANHIENAMLKRLDKLPVGTLEDAAARATAAFDVLRDIVKGQQAATPAVPKVMLFELMLLALAQGTISAITWQLLDEVKYHYQLENHVFTDLLERAQCTHREAQKTLAIILE
ncbi:hypothetical protein [Duganella sp. FT27W]|uniref:hypothetical protein n=1 Tax=Duganella sp. FT27W TaxID=2654636 RepID=UPI00128D7527|nr:hypothetical protein [Duganella sp. FT27W]MPQ60138.1 hypothetical protein [Duganella sp. FT27W]